MTSDATGTVIGTNLKRLRLRDSENQSECARRIARHGLDWNRDKVASLESGRRATVSVDELVILSWAYGVPIAEWFEGEGTVTVGASVEADLDVVRDTLRGNVPEAVLADLSEAVDQSADESIASRLGVELESVLSLAKQLWGHSTTEERDRRLSATPASDPKAIRTLRAGMTKRLLREIEQAMS